MRSAFSLILFVRCRAFRRLNQLVTGKSAADTEARKRAKTGGGPAAQPAAVPGGGLYPAAPPAGEEPATSAPWGAAGELPCRRASICVAIVVRCNVNAAQPLRAAHQPIAAN